MKFDELRAIAKSKGVRVVVGMGKADVIKAIQRVEGNSDCFGSSTAISCDQSECMWRQDCLPSAAPPGPKGRSRSRT